jgi:hypothetical protein
LANVDLNGYSLVSSSGSVNLTVSPYIASVDSNGLNLSNVVTGIGTYNGYFYVDSSGYLWWYNAVTTCNNQITST